MKLFRGKTKLIHYSAQSLASIQSREQEKLGGQKPRGLWFSVEDGDGWAKWCRGEKFNVDRLEHGNEIKLKLDAQVLHLESAVSIRAFTEQFSIGVVLTFTVLHFDIDWLQVAKRWQGIIIAPYQWSCRLDDDCFWYYGWDCSSGCIWDAGAIDMGG